MTKRKADRDNAEFSSLRALAESLDADEMSPEQRYEGVLRLAHSGDPSFEAVLAAHLDFESDPMVARAALDGLMQYLGLTEKYALRIAEFVHGVEWDAGRDVQTLAMSDAGWWLSQHHSPILIAALLDVACSAGQPHTARAFATQALARAIGRDWRAVPGSVRRSSPSSEWGQRVIKEARDLPG
jgi:hypothetical protein